MKKKLAILLALAMILSLAACGGSGSGSASSGSKEPEIIPKTLILPIKMTGILDGEEKYVRINDYDEYGQMIHCNYTYAEDDTPYDYYYENDYGDGYLKSVTATDGDMSAEDYYEFGSDGKILLRRFSYADYPSQNYTQTYEYNDKGQCIGYDRLYDTEAEDYTDRLSHVSFDYNEDGTRAGMEYIYNTYTLKNSVRYEDGGKKEITFAYYSDNLIQAIRVREFDENGKVLTETEYYPGLSPNKTGYYYTSYQEYYSDSYEPDYSHYYPSSVETYTYDADGKVIRTDDTFNNIDYENIKAEYDSYGFAIEYEYQEIEVKEIIPELYVPEE